jgi:hypothetical protein
MKINSILESVLNERAQFVPTVTAYHATPGKNLRSILKQGLVPNHQKDGYASNETSNAFGYSLSALKGVYFTLDYRDAENIAKSIDATPLIIICKVQKRSGSLDEDRLAADIIGEDALPKKIRVAFEGYRRHFGNSTDKLEQFKIDLSKSLVHEIIQNTLSKYDKRLVDNVKSDLLKYINLLITTRTSQMFDGEDDAFNKQIKPLQLQLTKKLKNLIHHDNGDKHMTFKVDGTVGYSGANKIVGIYNFNTGVGWGDLGKFERDAYHKVKTPVELIKT